MNYNLLNFLRNESLAEIVDTAYEGTCQLWKVYDPDTQKFITMYMVLAGDETFQATQKDWDDYTQDDRRERARDKMSQDEEEEEKRDAQIEQYTDTEMERWR